MAATYAAIFGILAAGFLFRAGEEASWGQHALGFESPRWFRNWNGQRETNFHNVFQMSYRIRLKTLVAAAVTIGGIALPLIATRLPKIRSSMAKVGATLPPLSLVPRSC